MRRLQGGLVFLVCLLPMALSSSQLKRAAEDMGSYRHAIKDRQINTMMDFSWPGLIKWAPASIQVLCQLGLTASDSEDFDLEPSADGSRYTHINGLSFKGALNQLTHYGWQAFQEAQSAMDEISIRTEQIPYELLQVLKYLKSKDPQMIEDEAPVLLKEARDGIHMCATRAKAISTKFDTMTSIIKEIIQGSTATSLSAKLLKDKLEREKTSKQLIEANTNERRKLRADELEDTKKSLDIWKKRYEDKYKNYPSGFKLIWEDLGNYLTKKKDKIAEDLGIKDTKSVFKKCWAHKVTTTANKAKTTSAGIGVLQDILPQVDSSITELIRNMRSKLNPRDLNMVQTPYNAFLDVVNLAKKELNTNNIQNDVRSNLNSFMGRLENFAKEIQNVVEQNRYRGQYSRYREKLRKLENEAACLKEQADTISTSSVKPVDLTNPVVPAKKNYDMRTSAAQLAKAQDMLEKKEEKWILINQRIQDIDIKLARVIGELKNLDTDISNTEDILKLLFPALRLLGDMGKHWKAMTVFFDSIETHLDAKTSNNAVLLLKLYTTTLRTNKLKLTADEFVARGFVADLYDRLTNLIGDTSVVRRISSKYTKLSKDHLLPIVIQATELLFSGSSNRRWYQTRLDNMVKAANDHMTDLAQQEKVKFQTAIRRRSEAIRKAFEPALGRLPARERHEITNRIKDARAGATTEPEKSELENFLDDEADGLDF